MDLPSGYWQISLEENSKSKTAFITQDSLFDFNVIPFGLYNAPTTFQLAILENDVWVILEICIFCYLNDKIIYTGSSQELVDHVKQIFDKLRQAGLKIKKQVYFWPN